MSDGWDIVESKNAGKALRGKKIPLPLQVRKSYAALYQFMAEYGPHAVSWKHFGKLKNQTDLYHCHLCGGRPVFVAVWRAFSKEKIIEVIYVGPHESAPY